jgi:hypothetical protein
MLTPIPLTACSGLIDLMLTGDEHRASFTINGVQCVVERVGDHASFEAITSDFGLSVVVPGWYAGEHDAPAHVAIVGEAHTCMGWLTLDSADKLTLIQHCRSAPLTGCSADCRSDHRAAGAQ